MVIIGGSSSTGIDSVTREMIRSIKEVVGNHSDADIYTALKETNMDADEAVHKLFYQDPFHEVKRKKDKKKEVTTVIVEEPVVAEIKKPSESIPREENYRTQQQFEHNNNVVRRGGVGRGRGGYNNQNYFPRNAAPRNPTTGPSRQFRVVRDNRSNVNEDKEVKEESSAQSSVQPIGEEVAIQNKQGSSGGLVDHQQPYKEREVGHRRFRQTGNVPMRRPPRRELNGGRQTVTEDVNVPPPSNSVLGVYSSSADPVHVPSPDSRSSPVGAIRREVRGVGSGGKPSENVSKDSSAAAAGAPLPEPAVRKDVPKVYRPFSPTSKIDQGSQTNGRESVMPNRHGNRNYQHGRTQQQSGAHAKGGSQVKQWKPKANQKSIGNNPGVIGTPKKSRAPPTDKSVNMESETVKLQEKVSHVSIGESHNVIIAEHIRVPESDRCQMTFGSFVLDFDPTSTRNTVETTSSSQEVKHDDINDGLPTPSSPGESPNGTSGTKTVETFDSEVRNSGDGSPPSEQQLSEQKEAPGSQNLDEYEYINGNGSTYTTLESKQQQDPLELHNFSDYDPRSGYDLPYFRQAMDDNMRGQGLPSPQEHMFSNSPASTIPMMQQQQAPMAQMYPQVHVSHFPNGMPYRQFVSPVYAPPMPMQGYSGNPAAAYAPHPSNGNSYVLMQGGSSHPGANGVKYGIQQFKPVPGGGPQSFSTFNNPNGYQISNPQGFEDSSRMKYKDGNVYVPNPQAETSEIWMQNSRDAQSAQYYNMVGQTPHGAYMSAFNSPQVQSSPHMQFQGVYHTPQPGPMANPHHMGSGNVGLGVAPSPSPVQVGAYQQQPQLGHLNWPANF